MNNSPPNPDLLSLNTATVREKWSLRKMIEGCARHGIRGIAPWRDKLAELGAKEAATLIRAHGLTVTGLPSDDLLRQILLGDSVKPSAATGAVAQLAADDHSARGDTTVKAVQQILADLGYAPGPVDGAMGGSTERAISAFQRDRKIAVTGRITPEMLREIKRVTGRSLAEAGTILR